MNLRTWFRLNSRYPLASHTHPLLPVIHAIRLLVDTDTAVNVVLAGSVTGTHARVDMGILGDLTGGWTYAIVNSSDPGAFVINPADGLVTVADETLVTTEPFVKNLTSYEPKVTDIALVGAQVGLYLVADNLPNGATAGSWTVSAGGTNFELAAIESGTVQAVQLKAGASLPTAGNTVSVSVSFTVTPGSAVITRTWDVSVVAYAGPPVSLVNEFPVTENTNDGDYVGQLFLLPGLTGVTLVDPSGAFAIGDVPALFGTVNGLIGTVGGSWGYLASGGVMPGIVVANASLIDFSVATMPVVVSATGYPNQTIQIPVHTFGLNDDAGFLLFDETTGYALRAY